jgi:hypothetical protein
VSARAPGHRSALRSGRVARPVEDDSWIPADIRTADLTSTTVPAPAGTVVVDCGLR